MKKLLFLSFLCVTLTQSEIMDIFNDQIMQLTEQNQSKDENHSKIPEKGEAANPEGIFKGWMKKHRRNYRPQEQNLRFYVFNRNQKLVEDHNDGGNSKFSMGLNKFADLTDKQFKQIYLSKIIPQLKISSIAPSPFSEDNESPPRLLQNWRDQIKFAPDGTFKI